MRLFAGLGFGYLLVDMLFEAMDHERLLDAAPARVNAKDTPIPYHPNLWSEHRPNRKSIAAKARQILAE